MLTKYNILFNLFIFPFLWVVSCSWLPTHKRTFPKPAIIKRLSSQLAVIQSQLVPPKPRHRGPHRAADNKASNSDVTEAQIEHHRTAMLPRMPLQGLQAPFTIITMAHRLKTLKELLMLSLPSAITIQLPRSNFSHRHRRQARRQPTLRLRHSVRI